MPMALMEQLVRRDPQEMMVPTVQSDHKDPQEMMVPMVLLDHRDQ